MAKKEAKYKIAGVGHLREILDEQKYTCALTGVPLTPQNTSFDHKRPLSKGGSSLKENLQATTKPVNTAKGQLSTEEFLALCFSVINHAGKSFGYKAIKKS